MEDGKPHRVENLKTRKFNVDYCVLKGSRFCFGFGVREGRKRWNSTIKKRKETKVVLLWGTK